MAALWLLLLVVGLGAVAGAVSFSISRFNATRWAAAVGGRVEWAYVYGERGGRPFRVEFSASAEIKLRTERRLHRVVIARHNAFSRTMRRLGWSRLWQSGDPAFDDEFMVSGSSHRFVDAALSRPEARRLVVDVMQHGPGILRLETRGLAIALGRAAQRPLTRDRVNRALDGLAGLSGLLEAPRRDVPGSAWLRFWPTPIGWGLLLVGVSLVVAVMMRNSFTGMSSSVRHHISEDVEAWALPGVLAILSTSLLLFARRPVDSSRFMLGILLVMVLGVTFPPPIVIWLNAALDRTPVSTIEADVVEFRDDAIGGQVALASWHRGVESERFTVSPDTAAWLSTGVRRVHVDRREGWLGYEHVVGMRPAEDSVQAASTGAPSLDPKPAEAGSPHDSRAVRGLAAAFFGLLAIGLVVLGVRRWRRIRPLALALDADQLGMIVVGARNGMAFRAWMSGPNVVTLRALPVPRFADGLRVRPTTARERARMLREPARDAGEASQVGDGRVELRGKPGVIEAVWKDAESRVALIELVGGGGARLKVDREGVLLDVRKAGGAGFEAAELAWLLDRLVALCGRFEASGALARRPLPPRVRFGRLDALLIAAAVGGIVVALICSDRLWVTTGSTGLAVARFVGMGLGLVPIVWLRFALARRRPGSEPMTGLWGALALFVSLLLLGATAALGANRWLDRGPLRSTDARVIGVDISAGGRSVARVKLLESTGTASLVPISPELEGKLRPGESVVRIKTSHGAFGWFYVFSVELVDP